MIGYKVVSVLGNELWSFIYYLANAVEYTVGEWTIPKPNCGPLFVFDTIENANSLMKCTDAQDILKLFRCEYEETKIMCTSSLEGAKFASRVKLLEEIA